MKNKNLESLKEGNARFVSGKKYSGDVGKKIRFELAVRGSKPKACILTCSDPRVVPEIIFDASLGDLFVIRTAGNTVGEHEIASIQYAVTRLGVKLLVIMGHTHCGSVHGYINHRMSSNLAAIGKELLEAVGNETDPREAEKKNAMYQIKIVKRRLNQLKFDSVAALYDVETGAVEFFE